MLVFKNIWTIIFQGGIYVQEKCGIFENENWVHKFEFFIYYLYLAQGLIYRLKYQHRLT